MIGIFCGLIYGLVARIALEGRIPEDTVLVTRGARDGNVSPRERKGRSCVIEAGCPAERVHGVTPCAISRESGKGVVWTRRLFEISPVAPETCQRSTGESVLGSRTVAGLTIERCMAADERKPGPLVTLDHVRYFP